MSSQLPAAGQPELFQIATSKKVPSVHTLSSPAERILAACDEDVFSVPDSYMLLRNRRRDIQREISTSDSPFETYGHHRLMPLLDALASLLVSQSRGEVVAVGFLPSEDNRVVLCIGENGSSDLLDAGENHLRQIWDVLKSLRATADQTEREKSPEDIVLPSYPTLDLYRLCYTFSTNRRKRHYDKAVQCGMHDALINAKANKEVQDQQDQAPEPPSPTKGRRSVPKANCDPELTPTQWQLVNAMIKVLDAYDKCAFQGGDGLDVPESCSRANDVVRHLNGELDFLDELLWRYASAPFNQRDGDTFQRATKKLLTIDASIRHLLLLCQSASCGYILDRPDLVIMRAERQVNHINYDFKTDHCIQKLLMDTGKMSHDKFLSVITKPNRTAWAQSVHAECTVLSCFVSNGLYAYPYIGVSQLSCVGCWYFFEAYNDVAATSGLPKYYTRGSHTQVYTWAAPTTPVLQYVLGFMEAKVETFFRCLVPRKVSPCTHTLPESSAASVPESGANMPWPEAHAEGPLNIPQPPSD